MLGRLIVILLLTTLALGGVYAYQQGIVERVLNKPPQTPALSHVIEQIENVFEPIASTSPTQVLTPGPLRLPLAPVSGVLTKDGIVRQTNIQRQQNKLPTLASNAQLDSAARAKLDDMFAKQYFEHISPEGHGPSYWVERSGYQYIVIGENLALGNFKSDQHVVQAWMDSPGHRANILNAKFQHIGVAARQGSFEGKQTWLAVQVFGAPRSACPLPDSALKSQFEHDKTQFEEQQAQLSSASLSTLVTQLNALAQEIERLAAEGNAKIEEGNREIEQGNNASSQEEAQAHWDRGRQLQAEGQALHEQARQKQAEYNELANEFEQRQATYNSEVANLQQQQQALQSLATSINQQIAAYNQCVQQYQ